MISDKKFPRNKFRPQRYEVVNFLENYIKRSLIIFIAPNVVRRIRDSSVGTATGCGLDDREVRVGVPVGSRILSSPRCPDRLWGPPSLLSNGYRGLLPQG
jgi:hypothetical protein